MSSCGTKVVELVVKRRGLARAFTIEHRQWAEAARLIDVTAVAVFCVFGDQPLALPQEFGGVTVDSFFDAAAEGVVLVGRGATARQAYADETVLAVVSVFGDEFLAGATAFADQIAIGVIVVMAVALHQQTVAFDVGEVGRAFIVLTQEVTRRIVGEAFRRSAAHADQPIKWVVVIAEKKGDGFIF